MQYTTVGRTGIKVSDLCFGAMSFGGDADEETSKALYNRCLEAGINFFDTADMYSHGRSEEILGKLMKGQREELVIASKVFFPTSKTPNVNERGLSRKHILTSIDASLKRLDTDYIDFYILHYFDPTTDIELTLRTLDDLQKQGKILYSGVSNWAAWQIMDALGISERELLSRFTAFANKLGVSPATLAVAWAKSHPAVTAPIIGARNLAQLEDSLAAADFEMTPELRAEISSLSLAPEPTTGRSEEKTLGQFGVGQK
ncbi:aldo/keto reductase [uncultured Trichococcus sp.]|uniref:aldo/keto reductase n=1 Tax=uncultured Trichococcus sp. TaxID=189665 RepID=UPI0029C7C73A|nr:aldo/keto reductase [uncultured Trichococcus sp.]